VRLKSRARASDPLMHVSATTSRSTTVLGFFMAIYSTVLMSLTLSRKVLMIVAEGVDDLDVLNVRDNVPSVAETFHVVSEALIMLLPDGLESLNSR
jgi:hypothetical protein